MEYEIVIPIISTKFNFGYMIDEDQDILTAH